MNLRARIVAGLAGAVAVLSIALAVQSSGNHSAAPPLSGWMEKFEPRSEPVPAPSLTLRDASGKAVGLDRFAGRVVLVNFWATWCAPCIREMPSLVRLQRRLGGPDFAIVAVSQDLKGFDAITPFVAKHALGALTVLHDPKLRAGLALKIQGLPTTLLFDRKGRELGRLTGIAEWDSDEAVALIRHYIGKS